MDSDLDIAVLMKDQEPLSLLKETNLTAQLEKKLRPLLNSSREFDIRFLRGAPPAFQFQVIKARNILWEGDPESRVRFERELLREYLDFRHYEDRYQEALKQRLKEGSFGRRPPIRR